MAIKKSARKALRQSARRKITNAAKKEKLKKALKELKSLASQNKTQEAQKATAQSMKLLDKAAKIGLIKKNTASRIKSRTSKLFPKKK